MLLLMLYTNSSASTRVNAVVLDLHPWWYCVLVQGVSMVDDA